MASSGLTVPMQRAWARAAIHLNLGHPDLAAGAAEYASSITSWDRFGSPQCCGPAAVYGTAELPDGWMFIDPPEYRALVSQGTFERFGLSVDLHKRAEAVLTERQPVFLACDLADWALTEELNDLLAEGA